LPGLNEALRGHQLVGIDTPVLIYQIEQVEPYFALTNEFFEALSPDTLSAVTSVLALMEIAVLPLRTGRPRAADDYEALLLSYPSLEIATIDRRTARRAAALRAWYRLTAIDALQVAAALIAGATAFLTNDRRLQRVAEIEVLLLDDFIHDG
jgi:predicted nucleic acid-binding protein